MVAPSTPAPAAPNPIKRRRVTFPLCQNSSCQSCVFSWSVIANSFFSDRPSMSPGSFVHSEQAGRGRLSPSVMAVGHAFLPAQLVEQCLGLFVIGRAQALDEPSVDGRQEIVGFRPPGGPHNSAVVARACR